MWWVDKYLNKNPKDSCGQVFFYLFKVYVQRRRNDESTTDDGPKVIAYVNSGSLGQLR